MFPKHPSCSDPGLLYSQYLDDYTSIEFVSLVERAWLVTSGGWNGARHAYSERTWLPRDRSGRIEEHCPVLGVGKRIGAEDHTQPDLQIDTFPAPYAGRRAVGVTKRATLRSSSLCRNHRIMSVTLMTPVSSMS